MLPGRLSGTAKRGKQCPKSNVQAPSTGPTDAPKGMDSCPGPSFEAYIEDTNILKALPQLAADLDVSEPRSEVGEVHRLACM